MKKNKLDKEEQEILKSVENKEWESVVNLQEEINNYRNIASETLNKLQKVDIEIPEYDLLKLKSKSLEKGIPFEIIIRTLIHNYNKGEFSIRL